MTQWRIDGRGGKYVTEGFFFMPLWHGGSPICLDANKHSVGDVVIRAVDFTYGDVS